MKRTLLACICAFGLVGTARAADLVRVGEGPFISAGGFFIARDKGYFKKLDIDIETREFDDGSMAVPAMISGELEISNMPAAAGLFNSVAKGAPLVIILDRGNNKPGRAYTVTNVTPEMQEAGVATLADFAKLKGHKIGVAALGSINQYNVARALQNAGLNPADDVDWVVNLAQPDLMKMLGQKQVDATDLAYQFGMFAQNNKWGPVVATGDQIEPGEQIATFAVRRDYLAAHRDVVVRWAMAYLQGVHEFNEAAGDPDAHKDILDILAHDTALNKPELVRAIAPHWSYVNEDGQPNVESIMHMQDFWAAAPFRLVQKKVTEAQLFDLDVARDANKRLAAEQPFK